MNKKIISLLITVIATFLGCTGFTSISTAEDACTAEDIVHLKSFILKTEESHKNKLYDMNSDGIWDIFDFCIMKHEWLKTSNIKLADDKIYLTINGKQITATLEDNSSTKALKEKLAEGDITVHAKEYGGFEKVGKLGFSLPKNDMQYSTESGDIMLYQGNQITLFYDSNSWSYTKLAHVDNMTQAELKSLLGDDDVTIIISAD